MVTISCGDCGYEYQLEKMEEMPVCPECDFGPESCKHPASYHDTESIYSVDQGMHIEQTVCKKCGTSI